ncbi:DUF6916 family protein [Leifsonia shinshuensis]
MTAGHAGWSAAAGRPFRATAPDGTTHELVLSRVSDVTGSAGWVSYALSFTAAPDAQVGQQTYALTGPGIAEDVFLVPSGRSDDALTLDAVFTHRDEETP